MLESACLEQFRIFPILFLKVICCRSTHYIIINPYCSQINPLCVNIICLSNQLNTYVLKDQYLIYHLIQNLKYGQWFRRRCHLNIFLSLRWKQSCAADQNGFIYLKNIFVISEESSFKEFFSILTTIFLLGQKGQRATRNMLFFFESWRVNEEM